MLSVFVNPSYSSIVNVLGIDIDFIVSGSSVFLPKVTGEGYLVDVSFPSGSSICNIRWYSTGTVGVEFDYPSIQSWIAADASHNSQDQRFTQGVQRYGLINTLNLDKITTVNIPGGMNVLASNSVYAFGTYGAGIERFNFTVTGTVDNILMETMGYDMLYALSDTKLIGEYAPSGTYSIAFDTLEFSSDPGTWITTYLYPAGCYHVGPKVYTDNKTIVWYTVHWDGSYPTYIYTHSFNLSIHSFAHNLAYTFTDVSTYFTSGVAPLFYDNRAHPGVIGSRTFYLPTILPAASNRLAIIIGIDPDGTPHITEHKVLDAGVPVKPISIQGVASDIEGNKIYFFSQDWDDTDLRWKVSSLTLGGSVVHTKEWDKYDPPDVWPCVYMVGGRNDAYRIENDGAVYSVKTNTLVGNLGQLNLPPHWLYPIGTVYPVCFASDDVYNRIYFNDADLGGGYLDCSTGIVTRNSNIAAGAFVGNRIIALLYIYCTRKEDFTAEQNAYLIGYNST